MSDPEIDAYYTELYGREFEKAGPKRTAELSFHEAARLHEAGELVQYRGQDGQWHDLGLLLEYGCWTEGPFRIASGEALPGSLDALRIECSGCKPSYHISDGKGVDALGAIVRDNEAPCSPKGRPDLMPPRALQVAGQVLAFGEEKHPDEKWRRMSSAEHIGACWRHMLEHQAGNTYDSESGELHLAHAFVRLGMALDQYLGFK